MTKPMVSFKIASLAQATLQHFNKERSKILTRINVLVKDINSNARTGLMFIPIGMKTAHIRVYSDGSFANNRDLNSQLRHVIVLCDSAGNSCILSYRSYKCRRAVKSVLASETCAFVDAFDAVR